MEIWHLNLGLSIMYYNIYSTHFVNPAFPCIILKVTEIFTKMKLREFTKIHCGINMLLF